MDHVLEISGLSKAFTPPLSLQRLMKLDFRHQNQAPALQDVSFSLEKGRILGILGPNGAGKTTLLKIISGLILPDQGSVSVNGWRPGVDDEKIKKFIGLALSSERSFYWRLTGKQNLEFFASLYGLDFRKTRERLKELFDLFEVDYQEKRFDTYSTGMQQKFALMRSLLHDPQLLLLDEPAKSIDYKTAIHMRSLIKEKLVKEQGKTVVFTSHNMDEAADFGDGFLILHKSRILSYGTLEQLKKKINDPSASLGDIFLKLTGEE
jgi:ABC-2 type transport system ATP-binding protein